LIQKRIIAIYSIGKFKALNKDKNGQLHKRQLTGPTSKEQQMH
jgi:hypothetical protein